MGARARPGQACAYDLWVHGGRRLGLAGVHLLLLLLLLPGGLLRVP
jgi:hypothetical protein